MNLDLTLFGAFGAGLLSFASPCVLPLAPAYLCFLTGSGLAELKAGSGALGGPRRGMVFGRALAVVLGFGTVFVALGATASSVGALLTRYFDQLAIVAGVFIIALGLHFLGIFRIALLFRELRFQTTARTTGILSAYVVGLAFAFGWTPCVGPILASILLLAGGDASVWRGVLLLSAYALGIGLPFLLAALFIGPFLVLLAKAQGYLGNIEKIMGAALVATGVLFITGGIERLSGWLMEAFPALGNLG